MSARKRDCQWFEGVRFAMDLKPYAEAIDQYAFFNTDKITTPELLEIVAIRESLIETQKNLIKMAKILNV
jgi:hypothetical protein